MIITEWTINYELAVTGFTVGVIILILTIRAWIDHDKQDDDNNT